MGSRTQRGLKVVRRIVFVALVVALLAPIAPAPTVHAAGNIQYVGTTSDDAGTATNCTNFLLACTLRDALNAAASGDTVSLPPGNVNVYVLVLTNGSLTIAKDVTIQGGGLLTVDGGGAVPVFTVSGGVTVSIGGLIIENGNAGNGVGGGIDNLGTLTVTQSVLQNNSAPNGSGGGISNGGALTLTDCIIRNNLAGVSGGGIADGVFLDSATSLTITGSTISGNTASMAGGGIFTQFSGAVTIAASTIQGNHATIGGGLASGYHFSGNSALGSIVTISGSTVRDNQATNTGGGIYSNNRLALTDATISGNHADGNGGGLFNEPFFNQPNATLTATTVSNNTVNTGGSSGGGIHNASGATVTLTDSLVAGNIATGSATAPDLANAVASGGHNLIGVGTGSTGIIDSMNGDRVGTATAPINPQLTPLTDNGGPTATHALLPNSPAIEAGGQCPGGVAQDQRGQPRVGACDIGAYEYQPVTPTLNDATGPAGGGPVTFHGAGFQTGSQLTIGGMTVTAPATGVSGDGTTLTLPVPAHSVGTLAIAVANPVGGRVATALFTYQPVVTSLSPASGSATGGGSVTITGAGFVPGSTSVMVGGTPATATNVTPTTIVVTVPAHTAGTVDVAVTVNGVSATKAAAYTYGTVNVLPAPKPTALPAASGSPGALPSQRPASVSAPGGQPIPLPPSR
ncbi:MAG: choice-of-anchor Q domain-containing protein [Thermomicrobiales bacterium]